ncbi:hypothetical protein JTB14_006561 [Gonioctena quinquepunctata]|nr:hypothetical protein JTB14_006561 [Gonioctena quinquepunctata]
MTSQESQDILDVRKKMWDKFFIKYEKSSRSSVDYSLSEIDNFLGESAISLSKSTNTDKSKIGPLSPLACNTMKKNFEYLKSLENHVENVLKSNLKDVLHKRGECKILESDEFDLWHQRAKQEIRNLKKHITKTQVEHYMTSITSFNKVSVKKFIDDLDTDLKKLLTKREFLRNDEKNENAKELDNKARTYQGKCPICLKVWVIPTVLQVSGYIFCFRCILRFLNDYQKCPVTNLPARPLDIVRLYNN